MPGPVEHDHDQIVHAALQAAGDGFQIVLDRRFQVHRAFGRRADHDLLHVTIGGMQQAAALGGGQHGDRAARAGGAEVGAFERIDGDIDRECARLVLAGAHLFADE